MSEMYGRKEGMDYVLNKLKEKNRPLNIVEIGSIREKGNIQGDGYSTVAWALLQKERPGTEITTLDINPDASKLCQSELDKMVPNHDVNIINAEGFTFLWNNKKLFQRNKIDMIYLDAMNDPIFHMDCFGLCYYNEMLAMDAIIFIDDLGLKTQSIDMWMHGRAGWKKTQLGRQLIFEREHETDSS